MEILQDRIGHKIEKLDNWVLLLKVLWYFNRCYFSFCNEIRIQNQTKPECNLKYPAPSSSICYKCDFIHDKWYGSQYEILNTKLYDWLTKRWFYAIAMNVTKYGHGVSYVDSKSFWLSFFCFIIDKNEYFIYLSFTACYTYNTKSPIANISFVGNKPGHRN